MTIRKTRTVCLLFVFGMGCLALVAQRSPFPEPEAVVSGFYIGSQQLAALQVIETVILAKSQPQSSAAKALLKRYRAKITELRTRNAGRPEFLMQLEDYRRRPSFRSDVLHRYLPEYENEAPALFGADAKYQPVPEGPNTNLMVAATALLMLSVPGIYLIRGERVGSARSVAQNADGQPAGVFEMPAALAAVKPFRLRLHLVFECGRIHDEKVETVTTKHSYLRRDRDGTFGTTSTSDYGTSFSFVTYHTFSLTTPDGRETQQVFTGDEFPAAVGDVISSISCGGRMLYAFNHTRGKFVTLHRGVGQTLRMRAGRGLWLATIAVAVAGGAVIMSVADEDAAWRAFWAVVLVLGFFSALYIAGLKVGIQVVRRLPFRFLWRPKLKKFMEEQTDSLNRHYANQ